jgi:DNA-binding XRE family transcriptional regulator
MPEIASRVRPLRESLEMGRAEFCEAVGVKKTTIINIEKGIQGVTEIFIVATCKKWPQFAYWFVTGITQEENGHISPDIERIRRDSEQGKEATG